jgi:hypothetical protein
VSAPASRTVGVGWPVAPPVPNEAAFYLRFFAEVASIRDQAGRPLHEVDFRAEIAADGVRRCPYPGSRHGRKMNWEALRVIAAEWSGIVEVMQLLRQGVSVEEKERGAGEVVWTRALLPMFLPVYMFLKGKGRGAAEVTTAVSGLFKVMLDVPTTLDLMLASQWAGADATAYTPDAIAGYAERTGILNNEEWTCAGPPGLIREVLEPVCAEDETALGPPPSHRLEFDLEEFGEFALTMTRQYALSQAFQVATAFAMEEAFAQVDDWERLGTRRPAALPAYERRRRILLGLCRDASSCRAVIRGFLHLSSGVGSSPFDGPAEACATELLRLTRMGGASPKEILEAQRRAERSMRSAVEALQQECHTALGGDASNPKADLSLFDSEDFPSRILRRRLEENLGETQRATP